MQHRSECFGVFLKTFLVTSNFSDWFFKQTAGVVRTWSHENLPQKVLTFCTLDVGDNKIFKKRKFCTQIGQ